LVDLTEDKSQALESRSVIGSNQPAL